MTKDEMKELLQAINNDYATVVEDGIIAGDTKDYVSTGSFSLNALISGSIYKGIPGNKIVALAGEPATGKTYFAINIIKQFLEDNKDGFVIYYETESALSKDMFKSRGVDTNRILIVPVATVQEFRTQCLKAVDKYLEMKKKNDNMRVFMVLDSLGGLSTQKEMEDIAEGKETRDMTRAQLIRGAFRVLTLKLGKAHVPMLITNHIYDVVGSYVPTKKMGGGCLVADTKIQIPNGSVAIEDIKVDDVVNTLFGEKKVTETFSFDDKEVFEISFDDNTNIKCSGDHKFLINGEWKSVYDLVNSVKNTEMINIEIADMKGNLDVYRQQIFENLLLINGESEET